MNTQKYSPKQSSGVWNNTMYFSLVLIWLQIKEFVWKGGGWDQVENWKLKIEKCFKRSEELLLLKKYNKFIMLQKIKLAAGWRMD